MEHVNTLMDLVTGTVSDVAKSDVVVGEPIVVGETTIIPLSRVSLGFGAGGGEGEGRGPAGRRRRRGKNGNKGDDSVDMAEGSGAGIGGGGGGKVRPVGLVIMNAAGVRVETIPNKRGVLEKFVDKVPDLIDMIKDATEK